jgi:hypothetical protein
MTVPAVGNNVSYFKISLTPSTPISTSPFSLSLSLSIANMLKVKSKVIPVLN